MTSSVLNQIFLFVQNHDKFLQEVLAKLSWNHNSFRMISFVTTKKPIQSN